MLFTSLETVDGVCIGEVESNHVQGLNTGELSKSPSIAEKHKKPQSRPVLIIL